MVSLINTQVLYFSQLKAAIIARSYGSLRVRLMPKLPPGTNLSLGAGPSVIVDEESGDITITVTGHGLVRIILMPDGDVYFEGQNIISDPKVPYDWRPEAIERKRPQ
jgi:hypothetical protein